MDKSNYRKTKLFKFYPLIVFVFGLPGLSTSLNPWYTSVLLLLFSAILMGTELIQEQFGNNFQFSLHAMKGIFAMFLVMVGTYFPAKNYLLWPLLFLPLMLNPLVEYFSPKKFLFDMLLVIGFITNAYFNGFPPTTILYMSSALIPTTIMIHFYNNEQDRFIKYFLMHKNSDEGQTTDLFHLSSDMLVSVDATTGIIVKANFAFAQFLNYDRPEGIENTPIGLYLPDDILAKLLSLPKQSVGNVHLNKIDTFITNKKGENTSIQLNGQLKESRWLLAMTNTRALDEVKGEVFSKIKLSSSEELLSSLAHELNNPLFFLKGNHELLSNRMLKNYPDVYHSYQEILTDIADNIERIHFIITQLKDLSDKESRQEEVFNINEFIQSKVPNFQKVLDSYQINLSLSLSPDTSLVKINANKLNQVLVNIIDNAKKAIIAKERPGNITLSTRSKDGSYIIIIEDDGVGISEECLSKIFEPFYSNDTTALGQGLGLPIARSIIRSMGGRILCESQEKRGTKVTIKIPTIEASLINYNDVKAA